MNWWVIAVGLGFAASAFAGARYASTLCRSRVPFPDGPAPIDVPEWPFPVIAAAVGVACALHGVSLQQLAVLLPASAALSACALADFRRGFVPDSCTIVPLAAIVVAAVLTRDAFPLIGAAFVGVPFAAAAIFSRGEGMGWGDVKLAALGGALLGARDAFLAVLGACAAAWVWSVLRRRVAKPTALAPYLVTAVAFALALGPVR